MFRNVRPTTKTPRRAKPRFEALEDRFAPAVIDLSVTSVVSDPNPAQGNVVTYTITVTNDGPDAATGVSVRDQVPDAFGTPANISDSGTVPAGTNDVEWTGLSIAAGASVQLTFDVSTGTINTFFAPTTALGTQAWNRPATASAIATYQGWETFSSPTGPNAPQTLPGPAFGGVASNSWAAVNAGGVADVFDSSNATSGSFITSTGNIYSPAGFVTPRVVVPNNLDGVAGHNPNGWTTLILHVRAAGGLLDFDQFTLNGSIAPVATALIATAVVPGLGNRQTWAVEFKVPGNADVYTFDIIPRGTSLSFDRVAVDTIWNSSATNEAAAYDITLPLVWKDVAQIIAADQVDTDSTPNNAPSVNEDDNASASVKLGTIPPHITSNGAGSTASRSIPENSLAVTTVTASDPETPGQTLTYSIPLADGGPDYAKFQLDPATGVLSFLAAPDFEAPGDVGGDNFYTVIVQVADGKGGVDLQTIDVTVTDVNESGVPTVTGIAPVVGPTIGYTVVITGSGFTGTPKVTFGTTDVVAPNFSVDSDTQLTVIAPPGTGTVDVTVTTTLTSVATAFTPGIDQITYTPKVLSATPNGNTPSLAGDQGSWVSSLVVVFNEAVELDADAMSLALHTNNVKFLGIDAPGGYGSLPTSLDLATADNVTWTVTFVGNTDERTGGSNSIKDGVYNLTIDGSKVHPLAAPGADMADSFTLTFHRLFGDSNPPETPPGGSAGADFAAIVGVSDNFDFRSAFNNLGGYQSSFDFDGDGVIGVADNFQFRSRFNQPLTWSV